MRAKEKREHKWGTNVANGERRRESARSVGESPNLDLLSIRQIIPLDVFSYQNSALDSPPPHTVSGSTRRYSRYASFTLAQWSERVGATLFH